MPSDVHTWGMSDDALAPPDPEELAGRGALAAEPVPSELTLGPVHLTVADLARSLEYYRTQIGLDLLGEENGTATLGAGSRSLLVLYEEPGARPADGYSGLFHYALLVPERRALARWLAHAARDRVALTGLSDHAVSEAIYLRDPDGHGIEIYRDRPREQWEGKVMELMTTIPLDTADLLSVLDDPAAEPFERLPDGTVMGHVHLRVAEIEPVVEFYGGVGFELMAQLGMQAAFLATGGYHHHLGANTWESAGRPQAPAGYAGLRHATMVVPGAAREELVDPSGNRWVVEG